MSRVLVAFDSWGGWRTGGAVGHLVCEVLRAAGHDARNLPLGDGGEGTADSLRRGAAARAMPGGGIGRGSERVVELADGVFVESADAVGPFRLGHLDLLDRGSAGLADLLRLAASHGPVRVGLGGSATVDGGLGLAVALGLAVHDGHGTLEGTVPARRLADLRFVTGLAPELGQVEAWCDVQTPLLEAPARFGPQKGATATEVRRLTLWLTRWAALLNAWRREHGRPPVPLDLPGGGSAGGLGFALAALLDAPLRPGAAAVADAVGLDEALAVDLVVTGEGRVDAGTFEGKVVGEVLRRAGARGVPAVVVAGEVEVHAGAPSLACERLPGADRETRLAAAARRVADDLARGYLGPASSQPPE